MVDAGGVLRHDHDSGLVLAGGAGVEVLQAVDGGPPRLLDRGAADPPALLVSMRSGSEDGREKPSPNAVGVEELEHQSSSTSYEKGSAVMLVPRVSYPYGIRIQPSRPTKKRDSRVV